MLRTALLGAALLTAVLLTTVSCSSRKDGNGSSNARPYEIAPVVRKDLVVSAAATGVLEPVRVIEVKSKASGEILKLPVESGDRVEKGALLAQIDPKDPKNGVARAEAELEVAQAAFRVAEDRLERSKQLLAREVVSSEEHEQVVLDHANARAALVTAEIDLDLARERLAEATVRAPSAGVIIQKSVEEGQIISSATSQVTGGTTLMLMADLDEVQVRTLVDETDIGRIHHGQEASITVDAYPNEQFTGTVLKVEPQAVVDQNVTTFPVLVRIPNERRLLLPGMNCEVEIEIHRRDAALTVPNEAVRTPLEARQTAAALGIEVEGLPARSNGNGGSGGAAEASPAGGEGGRRSQPGAGAGGSRGSQERGGQGPGASATKGGERGGGRSGRQAVVFAIDGDRLAARSVMVGVRNWDDTEIISGLEEGEDVAVMPSTQTLQDQARFRQRIQNVTGVPGLQRQGQSQGQGGR